jgi:translocation and assembly module TamB
MADPPPTRPRRRGRRLLVRLAATGLLLLLAAWLAPVVVARTGLRQTVLARVFADLDGTVTAGGASLGWFSPVELTDVAVTDPSGRPVLRAERVTSSKTLLALAVGHSDLGTFTIERPVLEVVCEPGATNVERAIAKYLADDTPPKPERTGLAVKVEQGRVVLKETGREGETTLDPFDLAVTVPRSRTEPVTLALSAGTPDPAAPGRVGAECAFGGDADLTVTADRFAVESLGPLVRRFVPGTEVAGKFGGKLSARLGADRNTVEGRVEVVGLELAGPWLGADRVRLQRAELPCKLTAERGELRVETADLTCDVGSLSIAGVVNPNVPAEKLLARPGLRVDADLDVAKLTAVLPRLLRIKEGTDLREGRVALHLVSKPGPDGTTWDGSVRTTALKGTRGGKPIAWESPLAAEFAGRVRPDGSPVFDKLVCRSDFVAVNARGSPEQFVAAANLDLDRLSARLAEFVDLGGVRLEGTAAVTLRSASRPGGEFTADGTARLTRFTVADAAGRGVNEPELLVELKASGRHDPSGPVRLDAASASLTAGADQLTAALVEPVADARTARTGKLSAKLAGDLARWRTRLGWLGVPADWQLGGAGTVSGVIALTADGLTADRMTADLTNARFRGAGLDLDERAFKVEAGLAWDRKTGAVALTDVRLSCETVGLSAKRLDLKPTAGGYGLSGTAAVTADVNRVQRALGLQADPRGEDALGGLAKGTVGLDTAGPVKFDADLTVEKFALGPPVKPIWTEPMVKVAAAGEYDPAADAVRFRALKLERDGFAADAKGSVAKLATSQDLDFDGALAYDLGKLEPQLRAYLGTGARVVGKDSRPFKLTGRLAGDGKPAAAGRPGPLAGLSGSAAVAWRSVWAYGFEVGPAELRAAIDRGTVTMNPVEAAFGGGKVRLEPTLDLASAGYDLSFARGRVVERARLTPAACADALGFALPAIAHVARADGLVSFDLDENRVPLADPDRAAVRGKLTVHTATVSPGPLVTEIATLLGAKQTSLTLAAEQVVPVRLENGRVHHENFAIQVGQSVVRTSGSVGLDGGLALVLDLPIPPRVLDRLLPKNPVLRGALAKQRVKVPVGGTLDKPQLDPKALDAAAEAVARGAAKDAAGELLKKGQEKLLEELQKKLGPPKK